MDELEAFWRGGYVDAVAQAGNLVAHPRDDLSPGVLSLRFRKDIQLVHQGMPDLEADDCLRLLHGAADGSAAVPLARVEVDLLVALLDADAKPPVSSHFLDRGKEDVLDLGVGRREVPGVDPRPLPHMLADARTANPGLA
ncbi:hypothetical protein D9M68_881640 [compost metagenome]